MITTYKNIYELYKVFECTITHVHDDKQGNCTCEKVKVNSISMDDTTVLIVENEKKTISLYHADFASLITEGSVDVTYKDGEDNYFLNS